ncbi:hypothetical protein Q5530_16695 [Saccharothrix sp. BKS2]|uniref:hypothetical protein n=1 Tax=Saccharothrix sp. BKS2 TaxID=3064400 RepID=UPI0039E8C393
MDERENDEQPLGPFTRKILEILWQKLFDPGESTYLPKIIRNGYPAWRLPSYDPTTYRESTPFIPIHGMSLDDVDSACSSDDPVLPPVSTTEPGLSVQNLRITNLGVMAPVSLSFNDTAPEFTVVVSVGTGNEKFRVDPIDPDTPNFRFRVGCCTPKSFMTRDCDPDKGQWTSDARGTWTGAVHDLVITAGIRVNVPDTGPLTVTVKDLDAEFLPEDTTIDLHVEGLLPVFQNMARIAVNEGVANGAFKKGINGFLNQPDVRGDLQRLINNKLEELTNSDVARVG